MLFSPGLCDMLDALYIRVLRCLLTMGGLAESYQLMGEFSVPLMMLSGMVWPG